MSKKSVNYIEVKIVMLGNGSTESNRRTLLSICSCETGDEMGILLTKEEVGDLIRQLTQVTGEDLGRKVEQVFDTGCHIDEMDKTNLNRRRALD